MFIHSAFSKRTKRWLSLLVVANFVSTSVPMAFAQDLIPPPPPELEEGEQLIKPEPGDKFQRGSDRLIKLNFLDAPLNQVLQFYSQLTGRTMILAPGVNATITLKGATRLTESEALDALDTVLAMNNVALSPMGDKFYKVVQPSALRQEGFPINVVLPNEPFPETDVLISQIIPVKHLDVAEVQSLVQQFIHGYGKIQPLEQAGALLVTDTAMNLQRITEILAMIDVPMATKLETRIYEIRFAEASEIASKLNELIEPDDEEDKQRTSTPTSGGQAAAPVQQTPPGIIRPRRPGSTRSSSAQNATSSAAQTAQELADKGIIKGKVKIVSDDRTNILFILSRPENFRFFDKIINILDRTVESEFVVRVVALEYAEASEIAGILNEFIGAASAESEQAAEGGSAQAAAGNQQDAPQGNRSQALRDFVASRARERIRETVSQEAAKIGRLSPNTKILADERTNSLLLMGRKADILALHDMIDQLDIMLPQVLIEAVIMEIDLRDDLAHGVDWLQRSFTVNNTETPGPGGGIAVNQPVAAFGGGQRTLPIDATFIDGSTVDRGTPLSSVLTYYSSLYDFNLDAVIRLAASSSDARILSTPVVMTEDNTEASIQVGEERPIITTTSTSTQGDLRSSYEYRNIGINLKVTPRINPERFVVMEINQQADDVGGTVLIDGNEVPIITKREFSASIGVENRETVILGGLVRTDNRKSRSKVPLLGDLPIIGALFRSDQFNDVRTELMVMITPYVMMTPDESKDETERLYRNSALPESKWIRGWTDSRLADPKPSSDNKVQRESLHDKLKKLAGKGAEEDKKYDDTTIIDSEHTPYKEFKIEVPEEETVEPAPAEVELETGGNKEQLEKQAQTLEQILEKYAPEAAGGS